MVLEKAGKIAGYYVQTTLNVFLFLLIVVFPYYAPEGYVKLGAYKYTFFRETGVQCLLMMLPAAILLLAWNWKHLSWGRLSWTDRAMLFYAAAVTLSYVCTDWKEKAVWGAEGWSMGLVSQLMFVAIYFAISRFAGRAEIWYAVFPAVSSGVFLIGLLNRFSVYPFGMDPNEPAYFISTIGNINWFCGYWSVLFPVGLVSCWSGVRGKWWGRAALVSYVVLGYMVGIVQGSSSGVLVLGAVLFVLFVLSFEENDRLLRWLELMLFLAGSAVAVGVIKWLFPMALNYESALESWMTQAAVCGALLGGTAACYAMAWYWLKIRQKTVRTLRRGVRRTAAVTVCLAGIVIVTVAVCCNIVRDRTGTMSGTVSLLRFDRYWGNGRGAAWTAGWKTFAAMPSARKLVGAGPDCFESCVYSDPQIAEMLHSVFGTSRLTNAHNELLTVLVNTGVCGLVSYAAIFATAIRRQIRAALQDHSCCLYASAVGILAYAVHNVVSFQQVVSTPLVFVLIGLGESLLRRDKSFV